MQLDQERTRHEEEVEPGQEEVSSPALGEMERMEYFGELDPMELNNTRKAKREILFFNRVPKVGSQTTMELLKQLSVKNNYHYHKDKTQKVERIKLTYSKEKWLANLVDFLKP